MNESIDLRPPDSLVEVAMHLERRGFTSGFPDAAIFALLVELQKYGSVLNLTGLTDEINIIQKHVYESALLACLIGPDFTGNAADLGTGNGFPGLALAAFYPAANFTLFEAGEKRAAFLENAIAAMNCRNAIVQNTFLETEDPEFGNRFDVITHRAFAKPKMVARIARFIGKQRHMLAGFGFAALKELLELECGYTQRDGIEFVNYAGKKDVAYLLVNSPE